MRRDLGFTFMDIIKYSDFRRYLSDRYIKEKTSNPSFSYGVLARKAGIPSRSYIKLILDGKRNLSMKTIPKLAIAFSLNRFESEYFEILVQFNQAKSSALKANFFERLVKQAQRKKVTPINASRHRYYTHWYYPVIRELILFKDFPKSEEQYGCWLKHQLGPLISEKTATTALQHLIEWGILEKIGDGTLRQKEGFILGGDGVIDYEIRRFHSQMIEKSLEHIDDPLELKELAAVTLAIKIEDLERARNEIKRFRDYFNTEFSAIGDADLVYQLNLQFFNLSRQDEKHLGLQPPNNSKTRG